MADAPHPHLPMTTREVYAEFRPDHAAGYDGVALGWALLFYTSFAALVAGWLPGWAFFAIGVIAIVRNFNALHEGFHASQEGHNPMQWSRWVSVVMGPLMLGYRELRRNHIKHHQHEGGADDPDAYLVNGHPLIGLFNALTQPEQSVVTHLHLYGLDARLAITLTLHLAAYGAIFAASDLETFALYNLTVRFGNTAAWWIFDYWLHQDEAYYRLNTLPFPRTLAWAWAALFSKNNLIGVQHHYIHHKYPFVPDRDLARLAARLAQAAQHAPPAPPTSSVELSRAALTEGA